MTGLAASPDGGLALLLEDHVVTEEAVEFEALFLSLKEGAGEEEEK